MNSQKQVVVFPRGQLNTKDRERLMRAGIIAVEADDPSKIVSVFPGVPLVSADEMLTIAIKCLAGTVSTSMSPSAASKFTMELSTFLQGRAKP